MDMTQEEKQKLIKDLSARLPYGVKLHIEYYDLQGDGQLKECDIELTHGNISYCFSRSYWSDFKPYLRPLSSATEEENIYIHYVLHQLDFYEQEDWYNKHHFDYRGLIKKGLALEAPEGMYKTE